MPTADFRKRSFIHIIAGLVLALVLFILPLAEELVKGYLAIDYGVFIGKDGTVTRADGDIPQMMTTTTVAVVVNILQIIKIFLGMALVVVSVRLFVLIVFQTVLRRSSQSEIASLLKTVFSIIIYIVSFFIIFQLEYPSVNLGALFTGSTILGIVVGLALQDTLGNLFAGIAIQADQPFQVGDVVTISNRGSGVVESVSWRGVKIRTFQNKLIIMSNAVMSKETIEVAPKKNLNARLVFFNTVYSASPSKTAQVVRDAIRHIDNVSPKMRPIVRIKDLGESGIDWEVKYWCENYVRYNDTDALVRQRIWYVLNREKIDFAFPTRTVIIDEKRPEQTIEDTIDRKVDQISAVSVFAPLSESEIAKLAEASVSRIFAPNEAIVRKGQEGKSMFIIVRGSVKVQILDGTIQRTINNLGPGDFFGEMSLLTGEPRSATVIADDETEVLQIRKNAIKPIFEKNPELMKLVGEIVIDRKSRLAPTSSEDVHEADHEEKGMLNSLKKFFGID